MKSGEVSDVGKLVADIAHSYLNVASAHHSSFHTTEYFSDDGKIRRVHLPHSTQTGLDCSALVNTVISEVFRKLGIQAGIPRHVREFFRWPMTTASQPNDLSVGALLFVYASQKRTPPSHIGIYAGDNQVIHSPGTTTGCVKKISFDNFISGTIPMDGYGLFTAKKLVVS